MKEVLGSLPEVITAYKNYNLLVPTATDVQLNPFYKFHVEEVPVDLGENSGDIFKVGSVKTGKQDERGRDIWEDVFSLSKPSSPVKEPGKCVSMLIDEEGRLKPNKANLIGSYLYEFDKHGCPIVGNILFIGEKMGDDGVEFCGISEENFSLLETELKNMITAMKATVKEMSK